MSDWKDQLSQMVYSTDQGRISPEPEAEEVPEGDGIVRLRRETKGRKGKGVTLVTGLALPQNELKQMAKKLKQQCGVGGSVKEYVIELQGDQRDIIEKLKMVGRLLKEALGRHFDGSWEASRSYGGDWGKMVIGSGPPKRILKYP